MSFPWVYTNSQQNAPWALMCLTLATTRLFFNSLLKQTTNKTTKPHMGIHWNQTQFSQHLLVNEAPGLFLNFDETRLPNCTVNKEKMCIDDKRNFSVSIPYIGAATILLVSAHAKPIRCLMNMKINCLINRLYRVIRFQYVNNSATLV